MRALEQLHDYLAAQHGQPFALTENAGHGPCSLYRICDLLDLGQGVQHPLNLR